MLSGTIPAPCPSTRRRPCRLLGLSQAFEILLLPRVVVEVRRHLVVLAAEGQVARDELQVHVHVEKVTVALPLGGVLDREPGRRGDSRRGRSPPSARSPGSKCPPSCHRDNDRGARGTACSTAPRRDPPGGGGEKRQDHEQEEKEGLLHIPSIGRPVSIFQTSPWTSPPACRRPGLKRACRSREIRSIAFR